MGKKDFREWAIERSRKLHEYEKVKRAVKDKYEKEEEVTEEIIIKDTEAKIYKKTLEDVETRISYIFGDNLSLEIAYVFEESNAMRRKRPRARWKSLFVDDSLGIEHDLDKEEQLEAKNRKDRERLLKEAKKEYIKFCKTEKAKEMTKEQRLDMAFRLAAKAHVKADQAFWEHPRGEIKSFENISEEEQKLFELLLEHLSGSSLFSQLKKDRWEEISKEKREQIFEAVSSICDTDEWKRDFVSRYKKLADLERIEEKLLHPERFRLGDCLKHLYDSVDYVGFCGTENDYKHVQGGIESLEYLVAELEDIYAEGYYDLFRKMLEGCLEVEIENGTPPATEKEEKAEEIEIALQDFFDCGARKKRICDMKKTLNAWDALTREQRRKLCLTLSEKGEDVAPPLKDDCQWKDNQELPNMFFVEPHIFLAKDRIKKMHSSVAHMKFEISSDGQKGQRERLEKKALELYEYIKMIEDRQKEKEDIMIKEADQREEKQRIRERKKELREAYDRQNIDKS
nr:hypothetical protein [uncultured Acetatifactor sp.]